MGAVVAFNVAMKPGHKPLVALYFGQVNTPHILMFYRPTKIIQILLVLLAMAITWSSVNSLQAKNGLPKFNQLAGWTTLGMFLGNVFPFDNLANRQF